MRELTADDARHAVLGGGVLACGGGGWKHHGELMGSLATSLERPVLAGVDELPADTWVATVTAIGAPAAKNWEIRPVDYVHALQELIRVAEVPITAVMTAQNGYSTTLNGWIQSAVLGVKVLDTAGDVRAHPTGKLGGLGLGERTGYESIQVVSGGNRELHGHFLSVNRGNLNTVDDVLRDISVRTGGFIASARNPVELDWVKANGAHGSISLALDLGAAIEAARDDSPDTIVATVAERLQADVLDAGPLRIAKRTRTVGGWDHGAFAVGDHVVRYLNEYLTAEGAAGNRVATYPDTIALIDRATGEGFAVKDAGRGGQDVALLVSPAGRLPVSSSSIDRVGLAECEQILGVEFLSYLDPELKPATASYGKRAVTAQASRLRGTEEPSPRTGEVPLACPTTGGQLHHPPRTVAIGGWLTPQDVADVAIGHARVSVAAGVRERLAEARAVLERVLATGTPTYGLNRGLGPLRDAEVPAELIGDFQRYVILSHSAAIGRPLARIESRATLLARLNTLAAGASGASPALFEALLALLRHDVIPVIPDQGSVGAADLSQLAAIGQVLLGAGQAWLPGRDEIAAGADALAAGGLRPLRLGAKDALALVGSNALSVGTAALAQRRAGLVTERADLVAALTLEAAGANLSPFDARVLAARPHPGQQISGRRVRDALAGGDLLAGRRPSTSVQDPISLRTVPQVHGAVADALDELERILVVELNCAPDNPYLDADAADFVSNGNFSITNVAIGFDALRIALAHLAGLTERRIALLVRRLRTDVPLAQQVRAVTSSSGYVTPVILAQTASALVAQVTHNATPISLTGTTVGDGVEDHSSMAYSSIRLTEVSLDLVERLLAVEALLAVTVIAADAGRHRLGAPVARLRTAIIDVTARGRTTAEVIDWVVEALRRERRGDDLAELRTPAVPPPVWNRDQEINRHDQLH